MSTPVSPGTFTANPVNSWVNKLNAIDRNDVTYSDVSPTTFNTSLSNYYFQAGSWNTLGISRSMIIRVKHSASLQADPGDGSVATMTVKVQYDPTGTGTWIDAATHTFGYGGSIDHDDVFSIGVVNPNNVLVRVLHSISLSQVGLTLRSMTMRVHEIQALEDFTPIATMMGF